MLTAPSGLSNILWPTSVSSLANPRDSSTGTASMTTARTGYASRHAPTNCSNSMMTPKTRNRPQRSTPASISARPLARCSMPPNHFRSTTMSANPTLTKQRLGGSRYTGSPTSSSGRALRPSHAPSTPTTTYNKALMFVRLYAIARSTHSSVWPIQRFPTTSTAAGGTTSTLLMLR